jgi:hypothetical protein
MDGDVRGNVQRRPDRAGWLHFSEPGVENFLWWTLIPPLLRVSGGLAGLP